MTTYPDDAQHITLLEGRRKLGVYHLWTRHDKWYWDAAGNNGVATTPRMAEYMAREWLRHGAAALPFPQGISQT